MKQTSLAARYARALADVSKEKGALESAAEEVETFAQVFTDSKTLREFLLNPALPVSRKSKALKALLARCGIEGPAAKLLEIMLNKGRMDIVPLVAQELRRIEEETMNRVSVEVITAQAMDTAQKKKVVASLEKFTGKKVRLTARVDSEILGGARTRIGSVVYDGTLATRLEKLRHQLIGER